MGKDRCGFRFIDHIQSNANVDEHIIVHACLRYTGEAYLFDDTAEAHAAGPEIRILTSDFEQLSRNGKAHGNSGQHAALSLNETRMASPRSLIATMSIVERVG